ncbi:MAG: hypothetical protein JXA96_12125 [Sedimentisphaerales bacterium]|nr:hypothetical protein [Sedimentisphaerales bacterium]
MKLEGQQQNKTKRQNDEESIKALKELTVKLCSNDITIARLAAFNLSWMQEDGLAILANILNGDFTRTSKKAAAYGLRSMKGRMKKLAVEVLEKGLKSRDRTTKAACIKALSLMSKGNSAKAGSNQQNQTGKQKIQEIPPKSKSKD